MEELKQITRSECYCIKPELNYDGTCKVCKGYRKEKIRPPREKTIGELDDEEKAKKEGKTLEEKEEEDEKMKKEEGKKRVCKASVLVEVGKQKTLLGEDISITQFANLKQKREVKEKVKAMFNGQMFRSIIRARDVDNNVRMDKIERIKNINTPEGTMERANSFGKKTFETLSTFPSAITLVYTSMLSNKGDKVYDPFIGHNSRATDVLSLERNYYGYDIHSYPVDFTLSACSAFPKDMYEINLGSSEKCKYPDNYFDFSITCPPYSYVEDYNRLYGEQKKDDLSDYSYQEFLPKYAYCLDEVYRVLKPNAFFVIVVGDIHKGKDFYQLSNDTDKICKEIGFIKHDENIYNRSSNIGGDLNYKSFILTSKRLPTIHEYILIYRKPEDKRFEI